MPRLIRSLILGLALALCACFPAFPATITVVGNDPTYAAVRAAAPGDLVQVSGLTGTLDLSNIVKVAPGVTVSATGQAQALDRIVAGNSQGLTIRGFEVAATASWMPGLYGSDCSRIVFDKMLVHSVDSTISGAGFSFRNCTASAVTNSTFHHVGAGGTLVDGDGNTVQGNTFSEIESDGILVSNSGHASIIGNHLSNFHPKPGDHPDFIQFFATAVGPGSYPTGSLIQDNVMERGTGYAVDANGLKLTGTNPDTGLPNWDIAPQGIFIESADHLTIRRNAISCSLYNAISLSTVTTALVDGNFISGCADYGGNVITRGASDHVTVSNNQSPAKPATYPPAATAGELPPTNYVDAGNNKVIALVPAPADGQAPDTTAFRAWVAANIAGQPPVVTPPPTTDPRDAQITALQAQVSMLATQAQNLQAQVATLQASVTSAQAQAVAASAAATKAAANLKAANDNASALGKKIVAALAALK